MIPIDPHPWQRARLSSRGDHFTDSVTRKFKKTCQIYFRKEMGQASPISKGAIRLTCGFYFEKLARGKKKWKDTRPDLDNFIKAIMDAGNGILWGDDGQIASLHGFKIYTEKKAHIILDIQLLQGEPDEFRDVPQLRDPQTTGGAPT